MHTQPLVSVIIPAYNAEAYIDDALRSVLAQSYPKIEIIVVDDGSTDATGERVAAYERTVSYHRQLNSGGFPGVARNIGMEMSDGDYICFLDADDVMLPNRVQSQVEFLNERREVGCVFGDYRNFSASGFAPQSHFQTCPRLSARLRAQSPLVLSSADATALLLRENVGIPSSLTIRRQVLECVPGFPAEYQIGEDFHFYYRISRRFSLGIIDQVLSFRRLHGNNLTRNSLRTLHDHVASYGALRDSEASPQHNEMLEEMLHQCQMGLARAYANKGDYRRSIVHNLRAMQGAFPGHPARVAGGLRSLVRTAAIATGFKNPTP
jgi:glycosyltransferase involved in cell wall biosynthesis